MKTISVALQAHLAQAYQTTATCWRITWRDGTVKAFTDHDRDLVVDDVTYLASSGYVASDISSNDEIKPDMVDVQGMLTSPSITEDDLRAGRWDFAAFEIFLVNWADLSQGKLILRTGKLGQVATDRALFRAELLGLLHAYARVVGELTSPSCRASLGDARCGISLHSIMVSGEVTGVNDDGVTFYDSSRSEPGPEGGVDILQVTVDDPCEVGVVEAIPNMHDGMSVTITGVTSFPAINTVWRITVVGNLQFSIPLDSTDLPGTILGEGTVTPLGGESGWFDFGKLTWLTGDNAGLSMEVKQYMPGQLTLALPMPYPIQIGDVYEVHPGCDKQLATCIGKFDNVANFRGEPYVPGTDRIAQVGRRG